MSLGTQLIEQSPEKDGGSVARAARLLGLRHQTCISMLNSRHRKLLREAGPPGKRLRSIIREPKE